MKRHAHQGLFSAVKVITVFILFSAAAGCKKSDYSVYLGSNVNIANDIVFAERGLFHTFNLIVRANLDSTIMKNGFGIIDNAIIVYDSTLRKFEIRYPDKKCADSTWRNGTIIIVFTGNFFTPGTIGILNYENYSEDGRTFIGKDSLVNQGNASGGMLSYASFIDSLQITKKAPNSTKWNSRFVYHIPPLFSIHPGNLPSLTITGSANGVSCGNYVFSFQISNALVDSLSCPWIREGTMNLSTPTTVITSGTIEYMNKAKCDNRVTYNFQGNIYEWWINQRKLSI